MAFIIECMKCEQQFKVDNSFAPLPEHPHKSRLGWEKTTTENMGGGGNPCQGSGTTGRLVERNVD